MIAPPPGALGAVKETVAWPLVVVTATLVGAPGVAATTPTETVVLAEL